jgi:hypothetical protein
MDKLRAGVVEYEPLAWVEGENYVKYVKKNFIEYERLAEEAASQV